MSLWSPTPYRCPVVGAQRDLGSHTVPAQRGGGVGGLPRAGAAHRKRPSTSGRHRRPLLQGNISAAAGLIGKTITGLTAGGDEVAGLVAGVLVTGGEVMLELETGRQVSIEDVVRVEANPPAEAVQAG